MPDGKDHMVKVVSFLGETCEKIFDHLKEIMKQKPDVLIVHVGTSDLTNDINIMNNAKNILHVISKYSHQQI